jgi:FeS assembly protein IscX
MRWTDTEDIAIELEEQYPDTDLLRLRFTDLRQKVLKLPTFDDSDDRCNEKVLEAIQVSWIEERE